jgi:hypothetical protein
MGYGKAGAPAAEGAQSDVPPDAPLYFDIEVLLVIPAGVVPPQHLISF